MSAMLSNAFSRRLNVSFSEFVRGKMIANEMNAQETFTANLCPRTSNLVKNSVEAMETNTKIQASAVTKYRK